MSSCFTANGPPFEGRAVVPPGNRGFTLVELVITLVLTGILAAVIAPRFFNRDDYDAAFFHAQLLDACRYGQLLATSSGCHVQLSLTSNSFQLDGDSNCLGSATPVMNGAIINPATFDTNTLSATTPGTVTLSGFSSPLFFSPDGSIRTGTWNGSIGNSLQINVSGNPARTITLDGVTGYIR